VDHAHAQLIVHRDLKPSNVMITRNGQPKLLDFGIAGLLDDGEPVDTDLTRQTGRGLTLGYAAPEQILGRPIGTAADVFSLGVMLFELLSGELPFAPRSSPRLELEHAVLHDEPRRCTAAAGAKPADAGLAGGSDDDDRTTTALTPAPAARRTPCAPAATWKPSPPRPCARSRRSATPAWAPSSTTCSGG
jgi:serine/threonine-protein kinase